MSGPTTSTTPTQLGLFTGEEDGFKQPFVHRTTNPVYSPDWSAIAAGETRRAEIPASDRERFAASHTLRQFYEHSAYGLSEPRQRRVAAGTLSRASLLKDRQALMRWETFSPRPADWPSSSPAWPGRPLAFITDQHVTDTLAAMGRTLVRATCRSTWNHLRTIFNHAVSVKALERAPQPTWGKAAGIPDAAKSFFTDADLAAIHAGLAAEPDLQTAFVLAVNAGLRPIDLFLLRWESCSLSCDRPRLEFSSRKTGKRQVIPLAAVTVSALRRWQSCDGVIVSGGEACGLLFPRLTDATAPEPEKSRPARGRNQRFKRLLNGLGLQVEKPWQTCRLTCNERLERHRPGSGQFVLGHSNTLNSVSYREPSGAIFEAVTSLPQPACFFE